MKTKRFNMKPMNPEEAALQLELVGHDFFVFLNAETDDVAVIYRRRDGHSGSSSPCAARRRLTGRRGPSRSCYRPAPPRDDDGHSRDRWRDLLNKLLRAGEGRTLQAPRAARRAR